MANIQQTNAPKQPIPPLTNIAPAIFVPLKPDELLVPFTAPTSRIERLEARIQHMENNRRKVRGNMLALYRREFARIIQEGQEHEAMVEANGTGSGRSSQRKATTHKDLDEMVANMVTETPDERIGPAVSAALSPDFSSAEHRSHKEWVTIQLQATLSQGLRDLSGYEAHVKGIQRVYREMMEREMQSVKETEMNLDRDDTGRS